MTKTANYKITPNFSLYEFVEGKALPKKAIELNWQHWNSTYYQNMIEVLNEAEKIRTWVNNEFAKDKTISVIINCGYRAKAWDLLQKRSGNSQHQFGNAIDITFGNVTKEVNIEIIKAVYDFYNNSKWMGGLAIKKSTGGAIGFVHIDIRTPEPHHIQRSYGARWEY